MIKAGKRTKAWNNARAKLKKEFMRKGITTCEARLYGCLNNYALGFAHAKKRRKLTDDELYEVALLCQKCHDHVEYKMDADQMEEFIKGIIERRS